MSKTLLRSALLAAALGLSTLGTPAQAAPKPPDPAPSWSAIVKTLAAVLGWLDAGCSMDPDGACQASQPPSDRLDLGCSADPNGRCQPAG